MREVVVTGAALATPLGETLADNVERCFAGTSAFKAISLFDTHGSIVRYAGEHLAPDAKALPDRKSAKVLSRRDQTSVLTAVAACQEARLAQAGYDPYQLGLFVGASCTNLGDLTACLPLVAKHADLDAGTFDSSSFGREFMATLNPLIVLQLLMNNAACFGSIALQIKGVNSNYMQYETAGLRALGEGYLAVAEGRAAAVVAGGTAQPVEPFQMLEAHHLGLLHDQSQPGFDPNAAVRPFDRRAAGTMLSESSAYLVLEEGAAARRRGARILGRIRGFALASDGVQDDVQAGGAAASVGRALRAACRQAELPLAAIGAVFASAAGVAAADGREALALAECLGALAKTVPVCAIKGAFGELVETFGPVNALMAFAALGRGAVPPTRNFVEPLPGARDLRLAATSQPLAGPVAAVLSRSRFGVTAALLVDAAPV